MTHLPATRQKRSQFGENVRSITSTSSFACFQFLFTLKYKARKNKKIDTQWLHEKRYTDMTANSTQSKKMQGDMARALTSFDNGIVDNILEDADLPLIAFARET